MPHEQIVIRGAREHNLKDVTVAIPRDKLVVITGLSGSGKSSLAFDTLYAEGQRRYVESLSAYARQFLGPDGQAGRRLDRGAVAGDLDRPEDDDPQPAVDGRHGHRDLRLPAAAVRADRPSPLPGVRQADLRPVGRADRRPGAGVARGTRFTVDAPMVRSRKGEFKDLFEQLRGDGYTRVRVDGEQRLLEEPIELDKQIRHTISVIVDRLVIKDGLRARLTDSIETALGLADGLVEIAVVDGETHHLLREVGVPRRPRLDVRAGAARVLVQLAARRLPALHRPGHAARDRSRPGGARPRPVDQRGRAGALDGDQLELLRAGDPGDRRPLRDRPRDALARPARRAEAALPARHGGEKLYVTYRNRMGRKRSYMLAFEGIVTSLERRYQETDSAYQKERIEEYMTLRPCPECGGRAPEADQPGRDGRRHATSPR